MTMKEALIHPDLSVTIHDVPIPKPAPGQILIKVIVSGTNPKDWKLPQITNTPSNQGDDIAGYIEALGDGVYGFHKGDKVAAFHEMMSPGGSYAEYAIAWARTTWHVDPKTSFEDAATVPLAAMTSALAVYQRLKLPLPWSPAEEKKPFVVYGGAAAVGAYAIKFATLSNVHPIVAVAGRGIPYVESLLDKSKGDVVIDYRKGEEHIISELQKVSPSEDGTVYTLDAVMNKAAIKGLTSIKAPSIRLATVSPTGLDDEVPEHVHVMPTQVGSVHKVYYAGQEDMVKLDRGFGAAMFPYMGLGMAEGWFKGHPYEVVEGGLNGLSRAMKALEKGEVTAKKLVLRIEDTN